jgi:hypothetical protein
MFMRYVGGGVGHCNVKLVTETDDPMDIDESGFEGGHDDMSESDESDSEVDEEIDESGSDEDDEDLGPEDGEDEHDDEPEEDYGDL